MSVHYFSGTCQWAKLKEPDEYNGEKKWKIDLFMERDELKALKATGVTLKVRENEEGRKYVSFNRPVLKEIKGELREFDPPKLFDHAHQPLDCLVGNGSKVTVKIETYDTKMGMGHRLLAVRVDELVPYEKTDTEDGEF
jgi:hypothetical protein